MVPPVLPCQCPALYLQAIERVNDLDPEILESQQQLFFHLQQQRLIELIRGGQLQEALEFAQVGPGVTGLKEGDWSEGG